MRWASLPHTCVRWTMLDIRFDQRIGDAHTECLCMPVISTMSLCVGLPTLLANNNYWRRLSWIWQQIDSECRSIVSDWLTRHICASACVYTWLLGFSWPELWPLINGDAVTKAEMLNVGCVEYEALYIYITYIGGEECLELCYLYDVWFKENGKSSVISEINDAILMLKVL